MPANLPTGLKVTVSPGLRARTSQFLLVGSLSVLTSMTTGAIAPAQAQLFNSPVDRLPTAERVTLRSGKPVVTGQNGSYVAKLLVTASPDVVWSVLTDHNNYSRFLPNVASSKVLQSNGNRKIVEQVDERQIFLMNVRSRLRSAVTETKKQRIDFRLINGDLKELQGSWQIEPVAPYRGAKPNQILITQEVKAQPKSGTPKGTFYNIFKSSLAETMNAFRQEIGRRSR
jgi:ribosome-associated toxin RatA of RatAB toxin-antitoxin module